MELMKATLKNPSHTVLLGRSSLQFFQKVLVPHFLCPHPLLEVLPPANPVTDPSPKCKNVISTLLKL